MTDLINTIGARIGISRWPWYDIKLFTKHAPFPCTNHAFLENPIWTFAKKWGLNNTYSNYSSILTYNETGYADYSSLLDDFGTLYEDAGDAAGVLLTENGQDQTARSGLALAGWRPKIDDMASQAVEWWEWGRSFNHSHLRELAC